MAYVIMKKRVSPIAITEATPHLIVYSLKEAKEEVVKLNEKAMSNNYWYKKVKSKNDKDSL